MKYLNLIFILFFFSCNSEFSENNEQTNFYEGTTSVNESADSVRVEIEERDGITVIHYLNLEKDGNYSPTSDYVSVKKNITQNISNRSNLQTVYEINEYQLKSELPKNMDSNYVLNEIIRNGEFACFQGEKYRPNVCIVEIRQEGNGVYWNKLVLTDSVNDKSIVFFDVEDKGLAKSYGWNWSECIPMSWSEYQNHKTSITAKFDSL